MTAIVGINVSGWSVIIFWFFVMILVGTLGLYLGPRFRNIMKSDKGSNIKYYDVLVIVIIVWLTMDDVMFWFLEGHYDGFALETAYISASIYGDIGLALLYYPLTVLFDRLITRIRNKWRVRKDDVD